MNQQPKYNVAETMYLYSEHLEKRIKLLEQRVTELEEDNRELKEFKHKHDLDKLLGLWLKRIKLKELKELN